MRGAENKFRPLVNMETNEAPGQCQENCGEVNPNLREYIMDGEPSEFTAEHRAALKKLIFNSNLKNIFIAVSMSALFLSIIVTFIAKGIMPEWWVLPILFAILVFAVIAIYALYANSIALKEADKGNLKCFKYEFYGKIRYVFDYQDGTSFYYANLGDFFVMISENAEPTMQVYGVVIWINGTEYFYLLI